MTTEIVKGSRAGMSPGLRQPPPAPGSWRRTPVEIEGLLASAPWRLTCSSPATSKALVLTGRVLNEKGKPIPDAVVALWMSDAVGNYDMVGYKYHGFQRTDAQGRYEFTCIIPGCYEPRGASHLHVKVQGDSQPSTTQLYIEGVPGNTDDHYYSSELLVHATEDANGTKHGTYDFVIKQVRRRKTSRREPGRGSRESRRGAPSMRGSVSTLDCQSSSVRVRQPGGNSNSSRRPSS